jgi:hypothetical protein
LQLIIIIIIIIIIMTGGITGAVQQLLYDKHVRGVVDMPVEFGCKFGPNSGVSSVVPGPCSRMPATLPRPLAAHGCGRTCNGGSRTFPHQHSPAAVYPHGTFSSVKSWKADLANLEWWPTVVCHIEPTHSYLERSFSLTLGLTAVAADWGWCLWTLITVSTLTVS